MYSGLLRVVDSRVSLRPEATAALACEAVYRALGGDGDDTSRAHLEAALARAITAPGQLEASVRWSAGAFRGGRLMLEAIPFEAAIALSEFVGAPLPPLAHRLADLAAAERLPLIGGLDAAAAVPLVKLYVNASDASTQVRRRLCERAGIAANKGAPEAPHVIGVNARRDGQIELKLYEQGHDEIALAAPLGEPARHLAALAARDRASAGAVVSWDAKGGEAPRPRAFFIATPTGGNDRVARLLTRLPGWSAEAVASALPFAPGPARSIGVSLRETPAFTVYFKPRGSARPVASLEPAARFRAGASEVGVFLEPSRAADRAYLRTARHAISYRCREGAPPRLEVEALMQWVATRVRAAEASGLPPAQILSETGPSGPPSPWHVVLD